MSATSKEDSSKSKAVGRRRFLQSLFSGLGGGTVLEEGEAQARGSHEGRSQAISFYWTNLHNGQIGFPTGMVVPSGQPGSIMKLVSAAALYENGLYAHGQTIECRGSIHINNEQFSCLYPHGHVELTRAIGLSCNVFFATAAQKLSPRAFIDYAARFGLHSAVDGFADESFPEVEPGPLHGDNAQYALGLAPDLRPNALQILRIAAIVATKGQVQPMHNTSLEAKPEPEPFTLSLKPGTWNILQQGMRLCDREGTGKHLDPADKLQLAVKTGTAPHGKAFQSWICGYFPYPSPRYAFCLRASGGTSIERAVPEARKWLFSAEWS